MKCDFNQYKKTKKIALGLFFKFFAVATVYSVILRYSWAYLAA